MGECTIRRQTLVGKYDGYARFTVLVRPSDDLNRILFIVHRHR